MDYKEFPALFAGEIETDGNIGLIYGHLSTAPGSFLKELLLYTYTKVDGTDFKREPLGEVSAPNCGGSPSTSPSRARCSRK